MGAIWLRCPPVPSLSRRHRRLVRRQGLGGAPAPARDAGRGAGRAERLAGRADRGGQDAGRLPADAGRADRGADRGAAHALHLAAKALAVDVQRNLLTPIAEMGLPIRVETRTGDTPVRPQGAPARAAAANPADHAGIAEPAAQPCGQLHPVREPVDAWSSTRSTPSPPASAATCWRCRWRGCRRSRPSLRRVGLSATVADPEAFQGWLAPHGDAELVDAGRAAIPAPRPRSRSCCPRTRRSPGRAIAGAGRPSNVMREIERHRTTLVFCNTRSLAELIFQDLWAVNDAESADRHPPRLAVDRGAAQGRGGGGVGAAARPGLHRQPRSRRRLGRRRPRHPDGRAQGQLAAAAADRPRQPPARRAERGDPRPRQPLRISGGARRARRDRARASSTPSCSAPARSTCSPSMSWPCACAAPFREAEMLDEVRGAAPYAGLSARAVRPGPLLHRERRLCAARLRQVQAADPRADGTWRV